MKTEKGQAVAESMPEKGEPQSKVKLGASPEYMNGSWQVRVSGNRGVTRVSSTASSSSTMVLD